MKNTKQGPGPGQDIYPATKPLTWENLRGAHTVEMASKGRGKAAIGLWGAIVVGADGFSVGYYVGPKSGLAADMAETQSLVRAIELFNQG